MPITNAEVIDSLDQLPAFPAIVNQILDTLSDENAGMALLVRHLQSDPVISARVLSAANRLIRHSAREPVADIHTAVSYLGLTQLHKVVVTTSLLDFATSSQCSSQFWEHSLAVGVAAQELAPQFGVNPDHALVAGLLHAVGVLWINYHHPQEYQQVLMEHQLKAQDIFEAEHSILGTDHGHIGDLLARQWGLPAEITGAIAHHHQPEGTPITPLIAVTHLAELICIGLDLPYQASHQIAGLSPGVTKVLGEGWSANLDELFGRIEARFRLARLTLQTT
jgi:putative nucleotidyltransferase with HDIG domain